jgi:hypothetical protein
MTALTDTQITAITERMETRDRPLPESQPARFAHRVTVVMCVTGRDRSWAHVRARELWPDEHSDYLAAQAA